MSITLYLLTCTKTVKMAEVDPILILDAIGAIVLIVGLALIAAKRRFGYLVALLGVLWLFTMGLYYWLMSAGIYGKTAAEAGYVTNAVGMVLVIVGLVIGSYAVGKVKRK